MKLNRSFVGMDVHKATISISVAEDGRSGPVRFLGVIPNTPEAVHKMAKQLARHGELDFCYEASGCGYGIYRQLMGLGHKCIVAAPSMIPRKPGERIKTDRRDSEKLAILHRHGDLTPVWGPDTTHEALRDLVRARVDASMHLMRARQQLLAFLLRHGRSYPTGKHWTQRHRSWLAGQTFQEHAHGIVFQDYLETVWTTQERRDGLINRISAMVASWSLGPLVEALRGLRGIDLVSAATFIASTGDLSRFESARLLMGFSGWSLPSIRAAGRYAVAALRRPEIAKLDACSSKRPGATSMPARIRTDNGAPFAGTGLLGLSKLSLGWMKMGIVHERIQPGSPQQNGRHERMHRTLKEDTTNPVALTLRLQQRKFDRFQQMFNHEPHEGLNNATPGSLYQPSSVMLPRTLIEFVYPKGFLTRRVNSSGDISWHKDRVFISEVFRFEDLGFQMVAEDFYRVFFRELEIGEFDVEALRFRPMQALR